MSAIEACAKLHAMITLDIDQAAARHFVQEILRVTGWSASALAKRAGLAHTTLTRFLKKDVTYTLSSRSLGAIRRAAMPEISVDQLEALWQLSQRTGPATGRDNSGSQHR